MLGDFLSSIGATIVNFFLNNIIAPILSGLDFFGFMPDVDSQFYIWISNSASYIKLVLGGDFLDAILGGFLGIMGLYLTTKIVIWIYEKVMTIIG